MAQNESEQHQLQEACGIACQRCTDSLTPGMKHIPRLSGRVLIVDDEPLSHHNLSRLITREAWSETARDAAKLFPPCADWHAEVDRSEINIAESTSSKYDAVLVDMVFAAAEDLKPTISQIAAVADTRKVLMVDSATYVINFAASAATFRRWHEVGHRRYDLAHELAHWHLESDVSTLRMVTGAGGQGKTRRVAAALATHAARDAWSAAVQLRERYLSPDPNMSIADRNRAVSEFATTWLGWKANVPEEKTEALIDALLSDEWPSGLDAPNDNVPTLLRGLVRERHRSWRPYDVGKIHGKSITSHSIQVRTESGEAVEMVDLFAGRDIEFGVEPHVALVRSALAELDPVEREVCLTYATCTGRRSWNRAAQLNGLPSGFGVNRVRRKIKERLQEHENAGRTGRRVLER